MNTPLDEARMAAFHNLSDQQVIADTIIAKIAKLSPIEYVRLSDEKKKEYNIYQDAISRLTDQHILAVMLNSVEGDFFTSVLNQLTDQHLIAKTIIEKSLLIKQEQILSKMTDESVIHEIIGQSNKNNREYYCKYFGGHVYENGNVCTCTRCGYIQHSETERELLAKCSEWYGTSDRYEVIDYDYKCKICGEIYTMSYNTYMEKWFVSKK